MSSYEKVHLFCINNAVIQSDLNKAKSSLNISTQKSEIERVADKLISDYILQFDFEIRNNARRMSEFYEIFYMLENDIRALVVDSLREKYPDNWWTSGVPQAVRESAQKNRDREIHEGLTPRSSNMIDYTNFGELGEIIKSNWDIFAGIFSNSNMHGVLRVISRLNLARGPIAHCGLLAEDEVVRLKLTVKDWLLMG